MIQVRGLRKAYGTQALFEDASFAVMPGERVGLVGRNGHGKTTLFRILSGEEEPDDGAVVKPAGYLVGHLSQHLRFSCSSALAEICACLPAGPDGADQSYRAKSVLEGLGFSAGQLSSPPESLSGGYQVRLNMAKLLVSEPNLLLLDEPTNYLDIVSLRWLTRFLLAWRKEMLLITHDHGFMDRVCTHTLGIHRAKVRKIAGPTAKYYDQIRQEEEIYEQTRLNQEKQIEANEEFITRFRSKASKASVVQSRIKALEKLEPLQRLAHIDKLDFCFTPAGFPGRWLLQADNVTFGYETDRPLIQGLSFGLGKHDRIAVIGRNGRGKSTLLRLLIGELTVLSGSVSCSPNLKPGYFGQTNVERLQAGNTVEQEILAAKPDLGRTAARGICGMMMFPGDQSQKKVSVLSGGERSRVLLGKILVSPANCLVLDEPTNHLDQESAEAFIDGLEQFPGAVIIVTHSESILERIARRLIVFDNDRCFLFEGSYSDFLSRMGWHDEPPPAQNAADRVPNKKDLRRRRAEIVGRYSKMLNPLKTRLAEVEERIGALEADCTEKNKALIAASSARDGKEAARLSREIHAWRIEIEQLLSEWEEVHRKVEEINGEYEGQLRSFDDASRTSA